MRHEWLRPHPITPAWLLVCKSDTCGHTDGKHVDRGRLRSLSPWAVLIQKDHIEDQQEHVSLWQITSSFQYTNTAPNTFQWEEVLPQLNQAVCPNRMRAGTDCLCEFCLLPAWQRVSSRSGLFRSQFIPCGPCVRPVCAGGGSNRLCMCCASGVALCVSSCLIVLRGAHVDKLLQFLLHT